MALKEEMHNEIARLEKEIESINNQLEKLHDKIFHLIEVKTKDERDLNVLQGSLEESYITEVEQESLKRILNRKPLKVE